MKTKRVLIADDEVRVATTLADSLERLGEEYVFDIVHNGIDALAHLKEKDYVLMITDYKMPGMNGLELAQAARQINDKIQVILMTAYGTSDLRNTVRDGSTSGYIEKPFSVAEIRDVVRRAIENTRPGAHSASHEKQTVVQSAQKCLKELQANTGARCILLINSNGFPLEVVGGDKTLDVVSIGALVAANFMAAAELANLLGNRSVFKSSYHEGEDFNLDF